MGAWSDASVVTWDRMAGVWGNRGSMLWKLGDGTVTAVAVGMYHVVLLTRDNSMYCIGDNSAGQCAHIFTNVSSNGIAVSMDSTMHMWPYGDAMQESDMPRVGLAPGTYVSTINSGTFWMVGIIGFTLVACVILFSCACAWCIHWRHKYHST
jgi:hypothetical protein